MRRAAVQALRTARYAPVRRSFIPRNLPVTSIGNVLGQRTVSSSSARNHGVSQVLQSSMYFRSFSVAAIVSLFASGVYYFKGESAPEIASLANSTSSAVGGPSHPLIGASVPVGISSTSAHVPSPVVDEAAAPPTQRKALVVEDDQFYTHDISDDAPLSKETGAQGQQQLEMLTPEQATEKLRRTEESYLVGRGRGVIRYDVVQIPSNNPIEDDHAEKIVEVPQSVTPGQDGLQSSDWMFWGVFDGHR